MKKLFAGIMLAAAPLFGGEFRIQTFQELPREITFKVTYKGEATEITLPARARLTSYKGTDVNVETQNRQRIGLRVGSSLETPAEFVYHLRLAGEPAYGNIFEQWYPLSPNKDHYLFSAQSNTLFVYPYLSLDGDIYAFGEAEAPRLASVRFTRLTEQGNPRVTVFNGLGLEAEPDEIRRLYQHNLAIFGDRGFDELVILNIPNIPEEAFAAGTKIFFSMPARGNLRQFARLIPEAWKDAVPGMSPRIFAMFKDAALRFRPLSMPPSFSVGDEGRQPPSFSGRQEQPPQTSLGGLQSSAGGTKVPQALVSGASSIYVSDPLWFEPSASREYYQALFAKGMQNRGRGLEMVDVNAGGLIENQAMLVLADKHLGMDSFFTGLKTLFQSTNNPSLQGEDYVKIDWDKLLQGKLGEPLKSFFLKDAFRPNFVTSLKLESNVASRNSDHIPNFVIHGEGGQVSVDWQGRRSVIVQGNGSWARLDIERKLPLLSRLDTYSPANAKEQALRALVLERAAALKTPSVEAFRRHLDLLSFPAEEGNPYEVEAGTTVYVAVSLVLSTGTGSLKPAIQEAFFVLDERLQPVGVITRLRL